MPSANSVLGLVVEQQAFNLLTGVQFSQDGPSNTAVAQWIERDFAKVEAAGSTPASCAN